MGFVRRLLPTEARELKASSPLKFAAYIRHVFYKASPGNWWNYEVVGGRATEAWAKAVVVWQSGLFISMATRILQLLAGGLQERKAQRCDQDVPLFG